MIIYYRSYEHSTLATLISCISRAASLCAIISIGIAIRDSNVILGVFCVIAAAALYFGGNKLSSKIGDKIEHDYAEKQRTKNNNLLPCHETFIEVYGRRIPKLVPDEVVNSALRIPAKITIHRDYAFEGIAARITYTLNDAQCFKIKYKEDHTFTTMQSLNTITTKRGEPVTFVVSEGEHVILHYRCKEFMGLDRLSN